MLVAAPIRQAEKAQRNIPTPHTFVPLSPIALFSRKPARPESPFRQANVSRVVSTRAGEKRPDATNAIVEAYQEWRVHWWAAAQSVMAEEVEAEAVEILASKHRSDAPNQGYRRKRILVAGIHSVFPNTRLSRGCFQNREMQMGEVGRTTLICQRRRSRQPGDRLTEYVTLARGAIDRAPLLLRHPHPSCLPRSYPDDFYVYYMEWSGNLAE